VKHKAYLAIRAGLYQGGCYECSGGGDANVTVLKARDLEDALNKAEAHFGVDKLECYDSPAEITVYEIAGNSAGRWINPPPWPDRSPIQDDSLVGKVLRGYHAQLMENIFSSSPLMYKVKP
jgi:hypothetical protein